MRWLLAFPLLLLACSSSADDAWIEDMGIYLTQVDSIDATWRSGVEAAYERREYLATGDLPAGFWTSSEIVRDVISNLEELVAATDQAISSAEPIEPPEMAADFHSEWVLLLSDMRRLWAAGLEPLRTRNFERFLDVYAQVREEGDNLNFRLNLINQDRNRLVDEAIARAK